MNGGDLGRVQPDAVAHIRLEALKRRRHLVAAWNQLLQDVPALRIRHRFSRNVCVEIEDSHRHARKHSSLLVADRAGHAGANFLSASTRAGNEHAGCDDEQDNAKSETRHSDRNHSSLLCAEQKQRRGADSMPLTLFFPDVQV